MQNRSKVAPENLARFDAVQVDSVEALSPRCDVVSPHRPDEAANRHLINGPRLDLMKPDAFLINSARGELVDQTALTQSLWFETIGGARLDVFDGEPRDCEEPPGCDHTDPLPHFGGATCETREAMGLRVAENVTDFLDGREPRDLVA